MCKTEVHCVKSTENTVCPGCEMRLSIFADLASYRHYRCRCAVCNRNRSPTSHTLPNPSKKIPAGAAAKHQAPCVSDQALSTCDLTKHLRFDLRFDQARFRATPCRDSVPACYGIWNLCGFEGGCEGRSSFGRERDFARTSSPWVTLVNLKQGTLKSRILWPNEYGTEQSRSRCDWQG